MNADLRIGSELSHYRITHLLGRGGMGVVYLAEDLSLERRVALKVLPPQLSSDEAFRVRFLRESKLAASMDHPNVIPIYEAGEAEGLLFIAMRYVEGTDLRVLMRERDHLDPGLSVAILLQVAGALDAAHVKGLVHRDVKPGNILLMGASLERSHAYLADFGLSRLASSESGITSSGQFVGTVDYAAPEQVEGSSVDGRADQYALACVAYECLTGTVPFNKSEWMAVLWAHRFEPAPRISSRYDGLPPRFDAVFSRALEKSADDRYGSCSEFVEALQGGSSGVGATVPDRLQPRAVVTERKVVTVLFCELIGSTDTSEETDPEDVLLRVRPYQERIRHDIEAFGGTVDRFIGDTLMAVFGAPVAHEDDAERAVRAALRIAHAISELSRQDEPVDVFVRIGICTGEAVVAPVSDKGGEGMVSGEVVSAASRLQGVAPPGGIVVSESTYRTTRDLFEYETPEPVQVQGKAEPIPIWRATAARSRSGVDLDLKPSSPLVGREDEIEVLKRTYARAVREGTVQLLTITGEPGVGKSRLVREFYTFIDEQPELIPWRQGRCLPYGEGITFWALGEVVKAQAGILESDDPAQAAAKLDVAVQSMVEEPSEREWIKGRLAPLVGVESTSAGAVERDEMFTAWRKFLEGVAATTSLVVVLEDIHWADPALLEFIEHLVDWSSGVALLVVCTARPELFERRPEWGGGKRNSTTISLAPLTEEETGALVAALLHTSVLPAELQSLLIERAGGNPLYAEEFVRMLTDLGAIDERGRLLKDPSEIAVPDTIQALIAARLDALPPERKALLQDAAVMGKVFWSGALASMGGVDEPNVRQGLHELARRELIRSARVSSVKDQAEYTFGHLLTRDVSYAQIPRAARGAKHQAAAAWVEALAGDRSGDHAEVLAHHYAEALAMARAAGAAADIPTLEKGARRYLVLAGDRAMGLDVARADAFYQRALELLPDRDPVRAPTLARAGKAAHQVGRVADARGLLEDAVAAFRLLNDLPAAADAIVSLSIIDRSRPLDLLSEAIQLLESETTSQGLIRAYAEMAAELLITGGFSEAMEWSERALALTGPNDFAEERSRALSARGSGRCFLGDIGGLDNLHEALRIAGDLGLARESAVIYNNIGDIRWRAEGPTQGLQSYEAAIDVAGKRGISEVEMIVRGSTLPPLFDQGNWDNLIRVGDDVLEWARAAGDVYNEGVVLASLARVRCFRGETAQAEALARDLLPVARSFSDVQVLSMALPVVAMIEASRGASDEAISVVEEFEQSTRDSEGWYRIDWLADIVRVAVTVGRHDMADRLIASAPSPTIRHRLMVLTATAVLDEVRGETDGALRLFDETAKGWESFGFVLEHGQTLLGGGRCLLGLGRPAEAIPLVTQARTLFQQLRARPLLKETDGWLGQASALSS